MNKKLNKVFFISLVLIPFAFAKMDSVSLQNNIQNSIISEDKKKNENPNNDPWVDYSKLGGHMSGRQTTAIIETVETEEVRGIRVSSETSIDIPIKRTMDAYTWISNLETFSITLYDVTGDQKIKKIHRDLKADIKSGGIAFSSGFYVDENAASISFNEASRYFPSFFTMEDANLEEFHDYQVGFNINEGDDFGLYSNVVSFSKPKVKVLDISETEDSITIEWELSNKIILQDKSVILINYKKITATLNGESYDITGDDPSKSSYTFNDLDMATNYNLTLGYEATKTIGSYTSPVISSNEEFLVSTKMPKNFSSANIIKIFAILLIILLILLLLLILMFLYSNKQRQKITELALVVDEDNIYENNTNYSYEDDNQINSYNDDEYIGDEY